MSHLHIAKCRDCDADIVWKFDGGWVPYNAETMDDYYPECHFQTCKKPEEKPLTVEQRTRPGYL